MVLTKIPDSAYEIIDKGEDLFHQVLLKEDSPYSGVIYQYGKVQLLEENDSLRVKFEYEIFDNPNKHSFDAKFKDYIGNILMNNLSELLTYNNYQRKLNDR